MDCPRCGAALAEGQRDFGRTHGDVEVVVTGVPARRCDGCQESFLDEAVDARLEALAGEAEAEARRRGSGRVVVAFSPAPEAPAAEPDALARLEEAIRTAGPEELARLLVYLGEGLRRRVLELRRQGVTLPPEIERLGGGRLDS